MFERCPACGQREFKSGPILWPELIAEWELSPAEVAAVDHQQGTRCVACGASLRGMTLARAICAALGRDEPLAGVVTSWRLRRLAVLELNTADALHPLLARLKGHVFGEYPQVDMLAMPYRDATFDLVVHSDTLEHIENPVAALQECHRVLRPGGALCFTVPVVPTRLSRSRAGLPKSYHGLPGDAHDDFVVHTEFGGDVWGYVARAGFCDIRLTVVDYPAGLAMTARRAV